MSFLRPRRLRICRANTSASLCRPLVVVMALASHSFLVQARTIGFALLNSSHKFRIASMMQHELPARDPSAGLLNSPKSIKFQRGVVEHRVLLISRIVFGYALERVP